MYSAQAQSKVLNIIFQHELTLTLDFTRNDPFLRLRYRDGWRDYGTPHSPNYCLQGKAWQSTTENSRSEAKSTIARLSHIRKPAAIVPRW
jgi:hypothetical protein